jgi:hypothetical protein
MSQNRDSQAAEIGSAVRAELARRGQPITALLPVLGLSRTSLYSRIRGTSAFDYVELHRIAEHLGMTTSQLVESASPRVAA